MPQTYKRLYGLDFSPELSDFNITLWYWKHFREEPFCSGNVKDPHELFVEAMRMVAPNGEQVLTEAEWGYSSWTEDHVWAWTHEDTIINWGAGGSSKSWDYGLLALIDWYADPLLTTTLMCSTAKEALLKRTFASVVHYHQLFKIKKLGLPGTWMPSKTAVVLSTDEHEAASLKNGIFGIAVKEGPVDDAVGRIRGMHTENVRLIVDELSAMPPAVWDPKLRFNLRVGAKSCKVIGLTNIDKWSDLAGRNSEPVKGRQSIDIDTKSWRSTTGAYVLRHDGFKSPAITEPDGETKYPYLVNQQKINEMIRDEGGNADSPAIMTMIRAFPPSVSNVPTILSSAEAAQWGVVQVEGAQAPLWRGAPTVVVGIDGGFGGDDCAVQRIDVGMDNDGRWVLWFGEDLIVPISAKAGAKPITDQILDFCLPLFQGWGLDPANLGVDDSGPQGLADAFARAWSLAIRRYSFGSRPSEMPVSAFNAKPACDHYDNCATELAFLYREYGTYRQLRNVSPRIVAQLTSRETLRRGGKLALIDKKTYKKTTGRKSPDSMDAGAIALGVVRHFLRLAPGASDISPAGPWEAVVNPSARFDPELVARYNNL